MQPFGDIVRERAAASAAKTLQTTEVPRHHLFRSLTICAIDETSAIVTSIEVGILSNGAKKPLDVTPGTFVAGQSHTIRFPCVLGPGQRIYATFNTPTAGDSLILSVHGVLMHEGEVVCEGEI